MMDLYGIIFAKFPSTCFVGIHMPFSTTESLKKIADDHDELRDFSNYIQAAKGIWFEIVSMKEYMEDKMILEFQRYTISRFFTLLLEIKHTL